MSLIRPDRDWSQGYRSTKSVVYKDLEIRSGEGRVVSIQETDVGHE